MARWPLGKAHAQGLGGSMTSPLAGQLTLGAIHGVTTRDRIGALRRANARPSKVQAPMDIGLWSDDAAQLDLLDIEMFHEPTNGD